MVEDDKNSQFRPQQLEEENKDRKKKEDVKMENHQAEPGNGQHHTISSSASTSPLSMRACESPKKTPSHNSSPLPPISSDRLVVAKRRRLDPNSSVGSSPLFDTPVQANSTLGSESGGSAGGNSAITPQKLRSTSTPSRFLTRNRRTPSLTDKPIPILSPPSPTLSTESRVSKTPPHSKSNENNNEQDEDNENTTGSSSSSSSNNSGQWTSASSSSSPSWNIEQQRSPGSSFIQERRSVTSPLLFKGSNEAQGRGNSGHTNKSLIKESLQLDREINKWRRLVELANKAQRYENEQEGEQDIKKLIEEWRTAARMAANHLHNETAVKVDAMGGASELRNKMEERQQPPFDDSGINNFNPQDLSAEDREAYEEIKAEYESQSLNDNTKSNEETGEAEEFTVAYMLKLLNVDHKLLFPEEYQ